MRPCVMRDFVWLFQKPRHVHFKQFFDLIIIRLFTDKSVSNQKRDDFLKPCYPQFFVLLADLLVYVAVKSVNLFQDVQLVEIEKKI